MQVLAEDLHRVTWHGVSGSLLTQVMRKRDLIRKNLVENACFEKEIMSSANNPFIVRSYFSFTSKDNLYIVMEFISGGDTASLLRSMGALDESVARQYIAETVLVRRLCSSMLTSRCMAAMCMAE